MNLGEREFVNVGAQSGDNGCNDDASRIPPRVYFLGGHHPANESFITSPPPGIRLHSRVKAEEFRDFGKLKQYSGIWPIIKNTNDSILSLLGMPRVLPIFNRCDLVHTNGSVIPICSVPWVASIENPSAFFGFDEKLIPFNPNRIFQFSSRIDSRNRLRKDLPCHSLHLAQRESSHSELLDWYVNLITKNPLSQSFDTAQD